MPKNTSPSFRQEKIFKVSEFNQLVADRLSNIGEVIVEGEITELKVSQNKWLFLRIKDEETSVGVFGVIYKIRNFDVLEPGMLVNIYGISHLYQKTARFSLYAFQIVPAGEGALRIAFEKLKLKLEKEGLFDLERKRRLPLFPEKIGLVTAKNSQAYSDFIKVLKERVGSVKIYFCPVQVQGKDSVPSILSAFNYFNQKLPFLDLLVLTRGGGGLEDLLAFNDESVARAIFASKIPVVCGVGHEKDITLSDLVADLRASTPSNAAELIVRDKKEVLREINESVKLMEFHLAQLLRLKRQQIFLCVTRLKSSADKRLINLHFLISRFLKEFNLFRKTYQRSVVGFLTQKNQLIKAVKCWHQQKETYLESLIRLLKSLDYRMILQRGFSITINKKGQVLKSVKKVIKNEDIFNLLFDGKIKAKVLKIKENKQLNLNF